MRGNLTFRACVLTMVLAGLCVAWAAARGEGEGAEVAVPVAFAKLTNMTAESGWLRLAAEYVQNGRNAVWLEAEEPTALVFQEQAFENEQGAFIGQQEGAGEGRYIAFVERAQYALRIATPGKYQVWYRAWFPWRGGWNHKERILGRIDEHFVVDCQARTAEDTNHWRWGKGPVYEFAKPGRYVWELAYLAGARLDRIVFTPDLKWTPKAGETGPRAQVTAPKSGTALTAPVRPGNVAAWGALRMVSDLREGSLTVEFSTDEGRKWVALPDGGDLSAVPVKGDGTDEMRFRVTAAPSPSGRSPVAQSLRLTYRTGRAQEVADYATLPDGLLFKDRAVPLVPADATGWALVDPGRSRLAPGGAAHVPDGQGRFWLEAEGGEMLCAHPKGDPAQAVEGASGRALYSICARPMTVRCHVSVPKETTYDLHFRVRGCVKPNGGHSMAIDGGRPLSGSTAGKIAVGQWRWAKSTIALKMAAGVHGLYLRGGFTDCWIDRIALVPQGGAAPEGVGPEASATQPIAEARVEFWPVQPPKGGSWAGLMADGEGLRYEVSLDGGEQWSDRLDAEAGADLELRARASLSGPSALNAICVGGGVLTRLPTEDGEVVFDADGSIYGVRGPHGWRVPLGTRARAFSISYQMPGVYRLSSMNSDDARLVGVSAIDADGRRGLRWRYELLDGALMVTTMATTPGAGAPAGPGERGVRMEIAVQNNSTIQVRHVDYPLLPRVGPGGDDRASSRFLFPQAFGVAWPNPFDTRKFSYRNAVWPGTAAMAWMDLASERDGLYLAAYHTDMLGVEFDCFGAADRRSISMGFKKQVYVGPGEMWQGAYCLWPHAGDWHAAADAYGEWADSWIPKRDMPDWIVRADGLHSSEGGNGRLFGRFSTHVLPLMKYMGYDYSQQWGSTCDGEFCGLHPALNPRYGTVEESRRDQEAARRQGFHRTHYINSQGYYPGFSRLGKIGFIDKALMPESVRMPADDFFDRWGLRTWGGKLVTYGVGVGYTKDDRCMCSSSEGWQDHMMYWLGQALPRDYGTDGSYIDQAACTFHYCYGEGHGHGKQHAACGKGYAEMLSRIHAEAVKHNPDHTLGVEGITDVLAPVAWGLWVTRTDYRGEVFLYTRPGSVLFRGRSNGHHARFPSMQQVAGDCFLYNRWDFSLMDPWFLRMVRLRRRVKDWMYDGRFMDDLGLRAVGGPVDAKWFLVKDKYREGAVINVHNWTLARGARIEFAPGERIARPTHAVTYDDEDGVTVAALKWDAGRVLLPLPATRTASILLVARAEGPEAVSVHARFPLDAGDSRIDLTVVNLGAEAISVMAMPEAGESRRVLTGPVGGDVPAHGVAALHVPLGDRNRFDGVVDVGLNVSWGPSTGGARLVRAVRVPVFGVFTNGGFERDVNADGVPDGWGTWNKMVEHQLNRYVPDVNLRTEIDGHSSLVGPHAGGVCLEVPKRFSYVGQQLGPPWERVDMTWRPDSAQYVFVRPNHRYHLSVAMRAHRADGRVVASLLRHTLEPAHTRDIVGRWQTYETEFATDANASGPVQLRLANGTTGPAWFDSVELRELGPLAKQ